MGRGGPSSQASWTIGRSAADSQTTVPISSSPFSEQNLKRTSSCLISEELHEVLTKSSHNFHHTHHTEKKKKKILFLILWRCGKVVTSGALRFASLCHQRHSLSPQPSLSLSLFTLTPLTMLPADSRLPPPSLHLLHKSPSHPPPPFPSCVLCTY